MRNVLYMGCLVVLLAVAAPAQAQHRADLPGGHAAVRLFDQAGPAFALNKLFSPNHFRMSHSYEMSFGSYGGGASSMGMYTNTMAWQFNQKLAARVDLAYAFSPFGSRGFGMQEDNKGRVFLRNAEIAYRPSENVNLHFSVRQSPYGSYMNPYGYYGGMGHYGYDTFRHEPLFWQDGRN